MIISKTPFRLSLVGGGTDLNSFIKIEYGTVINVAIDKYIYVVIKKQLGVTEYKYRINWSQVEFCNKISEIRHPIVREALKFFSIDFAVQISTFSDIPANTGLGSSSAFAVGLVNAICVLLNKKVSKNYIAKTANIIESKVKNRTVGKQDHYCSAYGNLNKFNFYKNGSVKKFPVINNKRKLKKIEENILLFYTGMTRKSEEILNKQNKNINKNYQTLKSIKSSVEKMFEVLVSKKQIDEIGQILHSSWQLKKTLNSKISNKLINNYYNNAISSGALGGKLLGAGNGGFLMFYAPKEKHKKIQKSLKKLIELKFKFDTKGSIITYIQK